jgi:hypothetical protein
MDVDASRCFSFKTSCNEQIRPSVFLVVLFLAYICNDKRYKTTHRCLYGLEYLLYAYRMGSVSTASTNSYFITKCIAFTDGSSSLFRLTFTYKYNARNYIYIYIRILFFTLAVASLCLVDGDFGKSQNQMQYFRHFDAN